MVSSSCSVKSYALNETQYIIAVTSSKQWIHFLRSDLCPPTSNNLQGTKRMLNDVCCLGFNWIKKKVTWCYHSSKISGSQQYFLIVMATSIVKWWKKRHGLPFCFLVQSCTGKSNMSMFSFFLPYLQGHGLLRSRNFATIAMWHNSFSSLFPVITNNSLE